MCLGHLAAFVQQRTYHDYRRQRPAAEPHGEERGNVTAMVFVGNSLAVVLPSALSEV
jgi:hypothetical protein